ncbi:MAG: alpha/beta hydrolase [Porticoccaceae bacterium]|jgi:acetyl esterase|nr:alpha/beta hydrolase [Porticoccaceae bacterium]MBT7375516.1 alpha/beta hydrolase [Porticoccaceae bacterium]
MKLITGQRILCTLGNIGPGFHNMPLKGMRKGYDAYDRWFGSGNQRDVSTTDLQVTLEANQIPIRIYRPINAQPRLTMVYFHGGGYVIGGLESHHGFCSLLASRAAINIVAVDYRLCPESPLPAPILDGLGVWNWVVDQAAELGFQDTVLGVGGDSAGGHLAAVLAMQTMDLEEASALKAVPSFQFLLYPWVDMDQQSESLRLYGKGLLLTEAVVNLFRQSSINRDNQDLVERISPMAKADMQGVPDTLLVTAEYDVLRDQGLAMAERLKQAGVNIQHRHLPDCTHGFISMGRFSAATGRRLEEICTLLRDYGDN